MPWFEEKEGAIVLNVRVVPRASKDELVGLMGDVLKIRIQAPPVDGKANAYLVKFLSKHWTRSEAGAKQQQRSGNIPRSRIEILSGETGRNKRIRICGPTDEIRAELLSFENE
jgi:uncharacterized protein (TIGR00251 family)